MRAFLLKNAEPSTSDTIPSIALRRKKVKSYIHIAGHWPAPVKGQPHLPQGGYLLTFSDVASKRPPSLAFVLNVKEYTRGLRVKGPNAFPIKV